MRGVRIALTSLHEEGIVKREGELKDEDGRDKMKAESVELVII